MSYFLHFYLKISIVIFENSHNTNKCICKTETDLKTQKTNLWLPRSKGGAINWDTGIEIYTLLYIK